VETINRKKVRMEIDRSKIADACSEAFQRNAEFGNGFEAGVQFAVKELESEKQDLVEMLIKSEATLREVYECDTTELKELIKRATE
jgi:hypothetical protein